MSAANLYTSAPIEPNTNGIESQKKMDKNSSNNSNKILTQMTTYFKDANRKSKTKSK